MNDKERNDLLAALRRRKPFDRMTEEHMGWLGDHLKLKNFPAGSPVLRPAIPIEALYFIQTGAIEIEAMGSADEDKKILAELVEGEVFPVEALEENRPVFSTFRAQVDTFCYYLTPEEFKELKRLSTIFADYCRYRSTSFLEQSRRVYRLHFSHQSEEQQRLGAPLSILMRPDPVTARPQDTIRDVLSRMHAKNADAVVIVTDDSRPAGIFTTRDLLRTVVSSSAGIEGAIDQIMTASPRALPIGALGYEAALAMAEDGFHHIVVTDDERLAGIVTEADLFNLQRVSLTQINAEIRLADSLELLKQCCRDIHMLAENMLVQGVTPDQITQIISTLNDQVISRTLDLELRGRNLDGIRVCWIALGSQGRFEQTFATDQDNAIIFETGDGVDPETIRARLLPIARRLNKALDAVGFPLCKGNIMAGNPECCLSFAEWQKKFKKWIEEPSAQALLNATIFFDMRFLYGDAELSDRLLLWLSEAVRGQNRFFHLLAENALECTPPVGFFRDFVVDDHAEHPNTIDIKTNGVTLFVDAARLYALAAGVTRSNTRQRLIMAGDARKWPQHDVNAWADAFSFLQSLRIRHQFELQHNGSKSHNRINPYELNNLDRKFFLESLRQAGKLQKQLGADFLMQGRM